MAAAIPAILAAGAGLLSAQQQRTAGKIAQDEAKVAASQEELAAVQREGDRKSRLAEAMAIQTAQAGAGGIAVFEGSPLSVLTQSIKAEEIATERDTFQSRISSLATRSRGRNVRRQSNIAAGATLLSTASNLVQT